MSMLSWVPGQSWGAGGDHLARYLFPIISKFSSGMMQSWPEVMKGFPRVHGPPDSLHNTLCLRAFFLGKES